MLKLLLLFAMLFLHIVDDYYLQGIFGFNETEKMVERKRPR